MEKTHRQRTVGLLAPLAIWSLIHDQSDLMCIAKISCHVAKQVSNYGQLIFWFPKPITCLGIQLLDLDQSLMRRFLSLTNSTVACLYLRYSSAV